MSITGRLLGTGVARTATGAAAVYEILSPDTASLKDLAEEGKRWETTYQEYQRLATKGAVNSELVYRAKFGTEVLARALEMLRTSQCCVIIVRDDYGRLLATATYRITGTEGFIDLQVIDPQHLAGSPGAAQLRGIGTALTAAISRQVLRAGVTDLYLHPLDDAADSFWRARGFQSCGRRGRLCIHGAENIARLINGCIARPEDPARGEILCVGQPAAVRAYSIPQLVR